MAYDLVDPVSNKTLIALIALITHYIVHRGEWDNTFHIVIGIWVILFGSVACFEYIAATSARNVSIAIQLAARTASLYFAILVASILLHRGLYHRLRKISGPFFARFSKSYGIIAGVLSTNFQYFKWLESLHKHYGVDVIRAGPREVTIYCADAIALVHGPTSKCSKSTIYSTTGEVAGRALHFTTNKDEHRQRRKVWDRAFNAKALREYEPRLNRHALALISRLKEQATFPSVRITSWVNFYSFDVMGDIGFNRSFGMVESGEEAHVIKLLHDSQAPLSVLAHISWAMRLIARTPIGSQPLFEHMDWSAKVLEERKKNTPKEKDVFSCLLNPNEDQITPEMNADSRLLIIAGSDTVSATLSYLLYELCKNLTVQAKLRAAIDTIKPEKAHLDVEDVAECAYLDGVINETLRLHPATPSGPQRETPPEGLTLPDSTYIPGKVNVWIPIYSLQRDPRYWMDPLSFMPERWTDERPGATIEKRAFLPFLTGPYNCIGQKLAMMELRSVTANLVRSFEITFADGENGSTIENKSRDCFTMTVGKLDVRLKPRYED
ncbi:unnamed protein product [Alternaria alternata]